MIRWYRVRRPLLLMLLLVAVPFGLAQTATAASYCDGGAYLTSADSAHTTLSRFDPTTGALTRIAQIPVHLNALAAREGAFYAIASPGGRPVRVALDGKITYLGTPSAHLSGTYVGAIGGGNWYMAAGDRVYTIALTTPLTVTGTARLTRPVRIGDWAVAADGSLLAVSTLDSPPALVRIDPAHGTVTELARPAGLARGSIYGATWMVGDQLYALHNGVGRIFRIDLTHPDRAVVVVASGIRALSADAASCPSAPPSPSAPPPPTPPAATAPPQPPPAASPPPPPASCSPPPASHSPTPQPHPQTSSRSQTASPRSAVCAPASQPSASPPQALIAAPPVREPLVREPPLIAAAPPVVSVVTPPAHAPAQAAPAARKALQAKQEPPIHDDGGTQRKRRWVAAGIVFLTMAGLLGVRNLNSGSRG